MTTERDEAFVAVRAVLLGNGRQVWLDQADADDMAVDIVEAGFRKVGA